MKRIFMALIAAAISFSLHADENKTIKIISGETDPFTILALAPHFCKRENLNVELTQKTSSVFKIGSGAIIVLERGDYDMAAGFLNVSLLAAAKGADIKIATGVASGGTAIIAKPGLTSYESLKGKKIGISKNSTGELILTEEFENRGMRVTGDNPDVTYVNMQTDVMPIAFMKGSIDAYMASYPFSRNMVDSGAGVVVDNYSQISRMIFSTSKIDPIAEAKFNKCFKDMIMAVNNPKRKTEVELAKKHAESLGLKIVLPPSDDLSWKANYLVSEKEIKKGAKHLIETKQVPETFVVPQNFYKPL